MTFHPRDEQEVYDLMQERSGSLGADDYGSLNLDFDHRDFLDEGLMEIADALFYTGGAVVRMRRLQLMYQKAQSACMSVEAETRNHTCPVCGDPTPLSHKGKCPLGEWVEAMGDVHVAKRSRAAGYLEAQAVNSDGFHYEICELPPDHPGQCGPFDTGEAKS